MGKKEDEPKDVGDAKQVKEDKLKFKTRTYIEQLDLKGILQDQRVRAFLWRLLVEAKIHDFGYVGDNNMLNHKEGRREIGRWVMKEILTADPQAYTLMQIEQLNLASRDTKKRKKKGDK